MERPHLHVSVPEMQPAIAFHSIMFNAAPSVIDDDYAKWMLDDPFVSLAISSRARSSGVDHVGIQVNSPDQLSELAPRLKAAGETTFGQRATACCYATSEKSWVTDPVGARWKTFYPHGDATTYGEHVKPDSPGTKACGVPAALPQRTCC